MFLLIGACLTFYFSYHAVFGQRGALELRSVSRDLMLAQADMDKKRLDVAARLQKVSRLRSDSLDLDFLEEISVEKLGYLHKLDVKILKISSNVAQQ